MFADFAFRDKVALSGVNSINWARVMAQIVYYFTSAVALGAPDRKVSFSVPTGNFGDVFAGYVAKKMGLPIDRLMIATNENDILVRTLEGRRYQTTEVIQTISPSMDIQVSSNFERALFDAYNRDSDTLQAMMDSLKENGGFDLPGDGLNMLTQNYDAACVSQEQTQETIHDIYQSNRYILDPHSAIGVHAARRDMVTDGNIPVVALGCAHAAKFPDAVRDACGVHPNLPPRMENLFQLSERFTVQPNSLNAIQSYIIEKMRSTTT